MNNAALKTDCTLSEQNEYFSANLEDGSTFNALHTELRSDTTPERGDIWVIIASDRKNGTTKTFTITFPKDSEEGIVKITEGDSDASVFYNDYKDIQNPTFQPARSGTIQYKLDTKDMTFIGSFNAEIDKAGGSETYLCRAHFDTILSL